MEGLSLHSYTMYDYQIDFFYKSGCLKFVSPFHQIKEFIVIMTQLYFFLLLSKVNKQKHKCGTFLSFFSSKFIKWQNFPSKKFNIPMSEPFHGSSIGKLRQIFCSR